LRPRIEEGKTIKGKTMKGETAEDETAEDETTEAASILSEAREHLTVELCRLQLGRLELLNFGAT
jgi:hypothetical protein